MELIQQSYYYWLKKIRIQACEQQLIATQPECSKPVQFAKLQVNPTNPNLQPAIKIHLSFATVEVAEGTSQKTVEAVLMALKNIC